MAKEERRVSVPSAQVRQSRLMGDKAIIVISVIVAIAGLVGSGYVWLRILRTCF